MNPLWYYHRLRAMRPKEILWRFNRLANQLVARFGRERQANRYQNACTASRTITEMIEQVNFYAVSHTEPANVPDSYLESTIASAERLLQHHYNYLALGEIDLGEEINWNREYKRGINTPLLFGPWMDYRDTNSYGDFKYFWELPRLQHLITLAKAYYLTGEENYAEEVINQIKGFIEQSPYLLGVNWIMPMEAAIRLVSISWITAFLAKHLKENPHACRPILQLITSHISYVTRNYSAYSSANNHLVAEAAGVFITAVCFRQLEKMDAYYQKAYEILCKEIINQHHPDGVNKEQAVHYQVFALTFFLLAATLARANNIELPDEYWHTIESSANFLASIANDNCSIPSIGDSDDGKAVLLSETDYNSVRSILATSAVLFNRSDFKAKAKVFDEASFWLLGNKGKTQFDNLNARPVSVTNKFDKGGYYILTTAGSPKAKLVFDCGPLGFKSIAAHGHADSLSFTLNAYGQPYFVDCGTYTYAAENPYRNFFRSTTAHNTIVVDSQNQSEAAGPFIWTRKANSFTEEWVSNEHFDRVTGQHDGYHRLQDPATHRRAISLDKEQEIITIYDDLEMKASHTIEQYFHLHPQCHVEKIDGNVWRIINTGGKIELVTDNKFSCTAYVGSENPICGWFSGAYDRKAPTHTIVCSGTFRGNQHFTTKIRLSV
jgi:hypothetical protein